MLVVEQARDVIDVARELPTPALAHGVNTVGVMGAGAAKTIAQTWPALLTDYRKACREGLLLPGGILAWPTGRGGWIYNLASQDQPGRHATYQWLETSAQAMYQHAGEQGIQVVAAVRIGCGIGGLDWASARTVLEGVGGDDLTLIVATKPRAR